jgi:RimJ/RimL family protein N-acetyltransferase
MRVPNKEKGKMEISIPHDWGNMWGPGGTNVTASSSLEQRKEEQQEEQVSYRAERLDVKLRPLEEADLKFIRFFRNSPDSMAASYQFWPLSKAEEQLWFEGYCRDATQRRFIVESSRLGKIGWVALTHIDHKEQCAEVGIRILPGVQRLGYGRLALTMLVQLAFEEANLHRLYSEVFETNEGSLAFFRSLGWHEWGRKRSAHWQGGCWLDVICFELLREENG